MVKNEKINILLVDDKESNLFALEQVLSRPDRSFSRAINGQEALKTVLNKEIDLIILDVQMPGMDGFEVAQILKSNKRTRDIPIIFASAEKKEHRFMLKGFGEGAVDYLHKPLDAEITEAKVSVLLQLHLRKKELILKNAILEKAEREIMQLNAELAKHVDELQMANQDLESFSYTVSHDLRAPIRSIHGYSQIILEEHLGQFDDELKRLFGIILQNAVKMGEMVDALLAFSRLGKKTVTKTPLDFNKMVNRVVSDLQIAGNSHPGIFIHPLRSTDGDEALLYQVFVNLVSNAVKYSGKKENPRIDIGFMEKDNEYVYYVKDNGAGFNMEYAPKLFGVFQRLHPKTEFEGTGVGLAIVQRIIAKHGGRVWAEGKEGEGATFYFSLPAPG